MMPPHHDAPTPVQENIQPCSVSYGPPHIWNFQSPPTQGGQGAAEGVSQEIVQVTVSYALYNPQLSPSGLQIIGKEPVLCQENTEAITYQGLISVLAEGETTTMTTPKSNLPHPLAGREGVGPPIAPDGWRWRPGTRIKDMYFWSPDGVLFRSQTTLNEYLSLHPGSPSPSQFRWSFFPTDYKEGEELPGTPIEKTRKRTNKQQKPQDQTDRAKKKRRNLLDVLSAPSPLRILEPPPLSIRDPSMEQIDAPSTSDSQMNTHSSLSLHTDIPSTLSSSLCQTDERPSCCTLNEQTLVGVRKPDYRLSTILASPNSDSLLADPVVMSKFIEETNSLDKKSDGDIRELRRLVVAIAEDVPRLKKHPKNALQFFYYLIRDEDAPSCFGVRELSEICKRWICKHQRTWCLREEERMRLLMEDCTNKASDDLVVDSVSVFKNCRGEMCCSDANFCPGCSCTVCKDMVDVKQAWSYIRCVVCSHISHVDCAVRDRKAGVTELDEHFLCSACLHKTELTSFCKARIQDAIGLQDRDLMEKNLAAALRVMNGVERAPYNLCHARLRHILSDGEYPDLNNVLKHILEYFDDSHLTDHKLVSEGIVSKIVDNDDIINEERKLLGLKKKADADYAAWMEAANFAESKRALCELLTKQLNRAEEQARIKLNIAGASRLRVLESEKKIKALELLKESKLTKGISEGSFELYRWTMNKEVEELLNMLKRLESLKPEYCNGYLNDGYLKEFNVMMEAVKVQGKKVKAAQSRFEQLICLDKLLK